MDDHVLPGTDESGKLLLKQRPWTVEAVLDHASVSKRIAVLKLLFHGAKLYHTVWFHARAKNISAGEPITVSRDNDKNSVVALREIADETICIKDVDDMLIAGFQKNAPVQSMSSQDEDLKAVDAELAGLDEYAQEAQEATSEVLADEPSFSEAEAFQVTDNLEDS